MYSGTNIGCKPSWRRFVGRYVRVGRLKGSVTVGRVVWTEFSWSAMSNCGILCSRYKAFVFQVSGECLECLQFFILREVFGETQLSTGRLWFCPDTGMTMSVHVVRASPCSLVGHFKT